MTHQLLARLLTALAFVAVCLVLPAAPAAACSCVTDDPVQQAAAADVAFSGVVARSVTTDDHVVHRIRVAEVYAGEVHRTQDVVAGRHDTCGPVGLEEDAAVLVLGHVDDEGSIQVNGCAPARAEGTEEHAAAVAALGEPSKPLAGSDAVERDGWLRRDFLWVKLVVGVVGLAALGVLASRWLRGRRA